LLFPGVEPKRQRFEGDDALSSDGEGSAGY
jgi:hypothetical protein